VAAFFLIARGYTKEFRMEAKLYVGNLSYQTTEQNLRELFMQAGNVTSVALIRVCRNELTERGAKGNQHVQWLYSGRASTGCERCPPA
jgi:hypothetical protein